MKKKILSVALIAMSLVSFTGFAQDVKSNSDNNTRIEKARSEKGKKDGKKMRRNADLFQDMNLTDSQKAKLQQLDEKRFSERKQQKEARKAEKRANDSIKMESRKASKKAYLQEVKEIIGPDQYVVFLENFYVNGNGQQKGGKMIHKGSKGDKGQMAYKSGDRKKDGKKDFRKGDNKKGMKQNANTQASL